MLCKQTADILYPTGIQFSIEKLCVTNIEMFDQEVYTLYERLLDSGAFKEAYEFAKLHSLPESNITVHKVYQRKITNEECIIICHFLIQKRMLSFVLLLCAFKSVRSQKHIAVNSLIS